MTPTIRGIFCFAITIIIANSTHGQDAFPSYLGETIQPLQVDSLWSLLSNVPNIKDEYESTEVFDKRVSIAMGRLPNPVVVEVPVQREFIMYNADEKRVDIQGYAFSNRTTKYDGVFGYGTPFYEKVKYGFNNIDVVLPSSDSPAGSYIGTNAMGVQVQVQKVKRVTKIIFDREARFGEELFLNMYNAPVLSFGDVLPDMARRIKETARTAIVYIPKAPYFAVGKFPWGDPTIENPTDIDESLEVAIGDIQCVLFLNSSGKVFGVVPTK